MSTPHILALAGLLLDVFGAALLAFDIFYGPGARWQAAMARKRVANARKQKEEHRLATLNLPQPPYTEGEIQRILEEEIPRIEAREQEAQREVEYHEAHEDRAVTKALAGVLLLIGGFVLQAISVILSAQHSN